MTSVLLMGDPLVARVPVEECGEPLVPAAGGFALSALKEADDPHRGRVREGVRDRLAAAQLHLPDGLHLLWVEGHRRASLQERYFTGYRRQLLDEDPTLTWEASYLLASRYVSPPSIAPHVSGAAIDLTLCDDEGRELDLGTPVNASPEESGGACYFDAPVAAEARWHRAVLAKAMGEAGLVNYPTEWWHWSYGDRYWAVSVGARAALYGAVAEE